MDDVFKVFFAGLSRDERLDFAQRCGTSAGYLTVSISRGQLFKAELCVLIERESNGLVGRKNLRPDDWAAVWPELRSLDGVA